MGTFVKVIIFALLVLFSRGVFADDSCECPKLSCNTDCEYETEVKFYSEKCAAGARVKSCARPTCVPIENAPAQCGFAQLEKKSDESDAMAVVAPAPPVEIISRDIASTPELAIVAEAVHVEGKAWVYSDKGKLDLKQGQMVRERDRIETGNDGRVQIQFSGPKAEPSGNIMNITPNSEVVIKESNLAVADADKKRVVLDLLRGRIRNKVEKDKFNNNEQSHYRVRMQGAVAGVRGTDFVASIELDGKEFVSKVETLTGRVNLADQRFDKKVDLAAGESAAFVIPKSSVMSKSDKAEFVAKGYLTPVYKLSADQLTELDRSTAIARLDQGEKSRTPANTNSERDICSSPMGKFNQCSWTCEKNPLGEKRCRTDIQGVNCVRRICNANGIWTEPTRLPSSYYGACDGQQISVGPCDY